MKNPIKITVVVPIYNVEKYLAKCIDSLVNQTLASEKFEILLIDDCSPDQSVAIAKEYLKKAKNVRLLRNNPNRGLGMTRNRGIKEARGEYVFFIDSDDYLESTALEAMLDAAKKGNYDIVSTGFKRVSENGEILKENNSYKTLGEDRIFLLQQILAHKIPSMTQARLIKKDLFTKHNIWFPLGLHEDVPVMYKLFVYAKKVCGVEDPYYYWVIRDGSITSHITTRHIGDLIKGLSSKIPFLKKHYKGGELLLLIDAVQHGWCKTFQDKLKLITEESLKKVSKDLELYSFFYAELKDQQDFMNGFEKFGTEYSLLKEFFTIADKKGVSTESIKEYEKYYGRYLRFQDWDSKKRKFLKRPRTFLKRLRKFFRKVKRYDGNLLQKMRYVFLKLIRLIKRRLRKG